MRKLAIFLAVYFCNTPLIACVSTPYVSERDEPYISVTKYRNSLESRIRSLEEAVALLTELLEKKQVSEDQYLCIAHLIEYISHRNPTYATLKYQKGYGENLQEAEEEALKLCEYERKDMERNGIGNSKPSLMCEIQKCMKVKDINK
jgi:hypothetical protein